MIRRALVSVIAVLSAVLGSTLLASSPAGATTTGATGYLSVVAQNSNTHALLISGYAFDKAHPTVSIDVVVTVDGHRLLFGPTNRLRADVNRLYHISGKHGFQILVPFSTTAHTARLMAHTVGWQAAYFLVAQRSASLASPSRFVLPWAQKYVNRSPYEYGGSSPSGFDCSGFSMYIYKQAGMRSLPHSADDQLHSYRMHVISRSSARPGDLVFYMSGGYAYHVAVYAGGGKAIAAIQYGEPVGYQYPSGGVLYGTNWH